MTDTTKKEFAYPQRLALKTTKSVRQTLCRLIRLRFTDTINATIYRDLLYGINILLSLDKHLHETDLDKRIEQLEQLVKGEGKTLIGNREIDSPYAADLRRQLITANEKINELTEKLLELKGNYERTEA